MPLYPDNWAVVIPLANEEKEMPELAAALCAVMDDMRGGRIYLVVDKVSVDRTLQCCEELSASDPRFVTCWTPSNRSIVDAYVSGFRIALAAGHEIVIEMDGGLSHDPRAIPGFLRALHEGNDCAFGSRYINGGSMVDSPLRRRFLSKGGTILARWLLGSQLTDMTSGFQAFRRAALEKLTAYPLLSRAHFYQTEVRHLLRHEKLIEVPIHYRAPSPRVSKGAVKNSFAVLFHYFLLRLAGRSPSL